MTVAWTSVAGMEVVRSDRMLNLFKRIADALDIMWLWEWRGENSNFTSSITTFHFFAALLSLLASFFSVIRFRKMSCAFITGKQGGNTSLHFAVCKLSNKGIVTSYQQTLEESYMIGHWPCCTFVIYIVIWTEELSAAFILMYCVNWNLNHVERQVLFN